MAILVDHDTQVLVQGITGANGKFHALACRDYGTKIVAGVTPGKGGQDVEGIPVYETIKEAQRKYRIDATMIYVPAPFASDAILEAIDAGVALIVCITEGIPVLDMVRVKRSLQGSKSRLIGPNCPGLITSEVCKIGIMPGYIHKKGSVAVLSRSGTLTYEAVHQLSQRGIGQSTVIGIGGDPIIGSEFVDLLPLLNADPATKAVVLIGEIGGTAEEEAAQWIAQYCDKPVVGFIAGVSAPAGRRMGHAGAIISAGKGTAQEKKQAFHLAGIHVVESPADIGTKVAQVLK